MGFFLATAVIVAALVAVSAASSVDFAKLPTEEKISDTEFIKECERGQKIALAVWLIAIALNLAVLIQGIHLLSIDYDINGEFLERMIRTAARRPKRGGIFLLLVTLFPYALIAQGGFFACVGSIRLRQINRLRLNLRILADYVTSAGTGEMNALIFLSRKICRENPQWSFGVVAPGAARALVKKFASEAASKTEGLQSSTDQAQQRGSAYARYKEDQERAEKARAAKARIDAERNPLSIEPGTKSTEAEESFLLKELKRIQSLKDRGLIDEEEFKALRRKALGI